MNNSAQLPSGHQEKPVRVDGSTVYTLNSHGLNLWWAHVQPGKNNNGEVVGREITESVAAAIASQSAVMAEQAARIAELEAGIAKHKARVLEFDGSFEAVANYGYLWDLIDKGGE